MLRYVKLLACFGDFAFLGTKTSCLGMTRGGTTNLKHYTRQRILGARKNALRNNAKMQAVAGEAVKVRVRNMLLIRAPRTTCRCRGHISAYPLLDELATLVELIHGSVRGGRSSTRWAPRGGAIGNCHISSAGVLGALSLFAFLLRAAPRRRWLLIVVVCIRGGLLLIAVGHVGGCVWKEPLQLCCWKPSSDH